MKKFLHAMVALCGLVSFSCGANAAGFNWTGWSFGLQGGFATSADASDNTSYNWPGFAGSFSTSAGMKGGVFGARAEYNRQFGRLVLGGFADINKSSISGTVDITGCSGCGYTDVIDVKLKWFGTVGAIVGFVPFDRALAYGLVGANYGVLSACERFSGWGYSSTYCNDYGSTGWTFGAGFKYALLDNVIAGIEWRHKNLTALSADSSDNTGYHYSRKVSSKDNIVLGVISWKF